MLRRNEKSGASKPMARVKSQDGAGSGVLGLFSAGDVKRNIVIGLIFLGCAGAGWGIMSLFDEADAPITWQSCLIERHDGSVYPDMMEIPTGKYQFSTALYGGGEDILMTAGIKAPFLIQKEEVKLADFKKYADYVNGLAPSPEKDRLMMRLGVGWQKGNPNGSSVNAVSWEGARDYAHWLGQQTGCSYDIPSQEEWVATVSHLHARDDVELKSTIPPIGPMRNLLWGVREWSRSRCQGGYYLLGRDDLTASAHENETVCMPAMFAIAGFRVVMNPVAEGGYQAPASVPQGR